MTHSEKLKYLFKSAITGGLYYSGLLRCLLRKRFQDKSFILMYHRIVHAPGKDANLLQPGMYVTDNTLQKHLAFLKKRFSIIPLSEMVSRINLGQPIGGCCSITFDDGWRDSYDIAFPLLKRYQVPAMVFLATGYIGTNKWFWPEELTWCLEMLLKQDAGYAETNDLIKHFLPAMDRSRKKNHTDLIDGALERVKKYRPDERDALLDAMRKALPDRSKDRLLMNWDEVTEMHESGLVSFGAHTVNHSYLDQVDQGAARFEISLSKQIIEDRLDAAVTLFAYPNGNYTLPIIGMLEQSGFLGAVTTKRGYVDKNIHLMEMPRISMHDDVSRTIPLFFSRLLFSFF